jgi:hypothetical protein
MARRSPPRKVTYFEPVPPRLARNTIIESTFEVGRRFRCTMRVDCGQRPQRGLSARGPDRRRAPRGRRRVSREQQGDCLSRIRR